MNFKKYFLNIIVTITLIIFQITCDASPKGAVNILVRGDYLRSPEIASEIEDQCGVKISYDRYYSAAECLSRASTGVGFFNYDIMIFPSDIYELIKGKIEIKNSNLNKMANGYSSRIKEHYLAHNYLNNVVYFMLSLSGFVWNSAIVEFSTSDSVFSMFEKAKNNIVIMMDSCPGMRNLIDNKRRLSGGDRIAEVFGKIIGSAEIYITNEYNKLYDRNEFAFAFQRSGDAIHIIKASKNKGLNFLEHPSYSYVTPDLLAELNARSETRCAARVLASKKILDIVQAKTYYLSPYGTYKLVNDPLFLGIYASLFDDGHKIRWSDSLFIRGTKDYTELLNMCGRIYLLPQVQKNHSLVLRCKSD